MLKYIKSLFTSKSNGKLETDLRTFALLPVYLMLNKEWPFDEWKAKAPLTSIRPELENLIQMYVYLYQFYVFRILTASELGNEVAAAIIDIQSAKLSEHEEYFSQDFEQGIDNIHSVVSNQTEEPTEITIDGNAMNFPIEYTLAITFLVTGKYAPFPVKDTNGNTPDFDNQDYVFAECLELAKNKMQQFTIDLIKKTKIIH
jgi:hypothetical protein